MVRYGAYATSEFGVVTLSEALREEFAPHNDGVSVFCPGPIFSNMPERRALRGSDAPGRRWPPMDRRNDDIGLAVRIATEQWLHLLKAHSKLLR